MNDHASALVEGFNCYDEDSFIQNFYPPGTRELLGGLRLPFYFGLEEPNSRNVNVYRLSDVSQVLAGRLSYGDSNKNKRILSECVLSNELRLMDGTKLFGRRPSKCVRLLGDLEALNFTEGDVESDLPLLQKIAIIAAEIRRGAANRRKLIHYCILGESAFSFALHFVHDKTESSLPLGFHVLFPPAEGSAEYREISSAGHDDLLTETGRNALLAQCDFRSIRHCPEYGSSNFAGHSFGCNVCGRKYSSVRSLGACQASHALVVAPRAGAGGGPAGVAPGGTGNVAPDAGARGVVRMDDRGVASGLVVASGGVLGGFRHGRKQAANGPSSAEKRRPIQRQRSEMYGPGGRVDRDFIGHMDSTRPPSARRFGY